jgi:hypothetical protein
MTGFQSHPGSANVRGGGVQSALKDRGAIPVQTVNTDIDETTRPDQAVKNQGISDRISMLSIFKGAW